MPKICPDHLGHGEFVGGIDRPDAGAGTDVQDAVGILQWRKVKRAIQQLKHDFVVQVQAVVSK